MKKSYFILSLVAMFTAQSASALCDFNEHIRFVGSAKVQVQSVTADNVLEAHKASSDAIIINKPSVIEDGKRVCYMESGFVNVVVSDNQQRSCQFMLRDGSDEWRPSVVSVDCSSGLAFTGIEKVGIYSYAITVNRK